MALCPQCGGEMRFDIASQNLLCSYCGASFEVKARKVQVANADEHIISNADQQSVTNQLSDLDQLGDNDPLSATAQFSDESEVPTTVFTCPQCGGEIMSTDTTAAAFCSFCGASTVLNTRLVSTKRPTYIIPFKKTKEDCKKAVSDYLALAFFAPQALRNMGKADSFRGIYIPYWGYNVITDGAFKLKREDSYREGDYVITKVYQREGTIKANYKWLFFDASSSFYDELSCHIAPFHSEELKDFSTSYLSGFYGDICDVPSEVYNEDSRLTAHELSVELLGQQDFAKNYRVGQDDIDKKNTKLISSISTMLPVWFMSYRYGDRLIYITINGQTGKVVADVPVSKIKYLIGSLLLALPFYWIYERMMVLTPITLLQIIDALAIFAILMHYSQTTSIASRCQHSDDKGIEYSRTKTILDVIYTPSSDTDIQSENIMWSGAAIICLPILVAIAWYFDDDIDIQFILTGSMMFISAGAVVLGLMATSNARSAPTDSRKWFSPVLFVISALVALAVHLCRPVCDSWYYGASILQLAAICALFADIITQYNTLATRPLPQFNRQGGDDNA